MEASLSSMQHIKVGAFRCLCYIDKAACLFLYGCVNAADIAECEDA